MPDTPTFREQIEAAAGRDPLVFDVLAVARADGLDWTRTLEMLVARLQSERVRLAGELVPFRKHGVQMVPVYSMEEVSRDGLDPHGRPPESGEWVPIQWLAIQKDQAAEEAAES